MSVQTALLSANVRTTLEVLAFLKNLVSIKFAGHGGGSDEIRRRNNWCNQPGHVSNNTQSISYHNNSQIKQVSYDREKDFGRKRRFQDVRLSADGRHEEQWAELDN
jgi:hypothetical protein